MTNTTKRLILLVEDNPDEELLTVDALRQNGVTAAVAVAHDGAEALDFLFGSGVYASRDTTEQPQLVLLDLKLPKISGHDVLRQIRTNDGTKYTPVVILTSSSEPSDVEKCYESGVNSYVQKPVEFERFVEVVRTMGVYWLHFNLVPAR